MVTLREQLKEKEEHIISAIQRNGVNSIYQHKLIKVARIKLLSVKLNDSYRILFRRGSTQWVHWKTIHRKDLEFVAKNI